MPMPERLTRHTKRLYCDKVCARMRWYGGAATLVAPDADKSAAL